MTGNPPDPTRPLLQQRDFSALWWGQLISILGERLTYLALGGLLLEHTGGLKDDRSSLLLAVLGNVMLAPVLLFSPFTGPWVDRWDLKRVLVFSDLLRAGLVILIPILYTSTGHTFPVFAIVFALFTCNVFFLPAKSAITPEIVPQAQLLPANALLAGAGIVATAVGALGGGWLIDHLGWAFGLYVNGVTYLVSVIALLLIRYRPEAHTPHSAEVTVGGYLAELGEGWNLVRRSPAVGLALTAAAAVWIGGGFLHVAGNLHVQRAASAPGMERIGLLLAALGVGSAISTWWLNTRGRAVPRPWLLGGGMILAAAGVFAFSLSTRFAVFAGCAFAIGLAAAPAFMLTETILQESTETRQRGRVFSARDFLMRLVFLVAVSVAGWATPALGVRPTLVICAALMAVVGLLSIAWGRRAPALMRNGSPADTGTP